MSDVLDSNELKRELGAVAEALTVCLMKTVDSTNAEARRRAIEGVNAPVLIAAEAQTAGRGRLGRSFHSPVGVGIYASLLIPMREKPENAVGITCAASVALMRAIRSLTGKQTEIKWVNDLYWNGKKVCGILTEAVSMGERTYLIIGFGINLRPCVFPSELADVAGSLNEETLSRAELLGAAVREMHRFWADLRDRTWLEDYRAHSLVLGKPVYFLQNNERQEGLAEGIDADGGLAVRLENGERVVLRSGEISLRVKQ